MRVPSSLEVQLKQDAYGAGFHDAPYDRPGTYLETIAYVFYLVLHFPLNDG